MASVRFEVVDVASGEIIETRSYGTRFSYSMPGGSGRSIAAADLDAGEYVVRVEPPTATIAMGTPPDRDLGDFAPPFLIAGPMVLIGAGIAVWGAIRGSRERTRLATSSLPPPAASSWATGTWDDGPDR